MRSHVRYLSFAYLYRLSMIAMASSGTQKRKAKCWQLSLQSIGQLNCQVCKTRSTTWQLCNFLCRFILGGILAQKFGTKLVFGWEKNSNIFFPNLEFYCPTIQICKLLWLRNLFLSANSRLFEFLCFVLAEVNSRSRRRCCMAGNVTYGWWVYQNLFTNWFKRNNFQ